MFFLSHHSHPPLGSSRQSLSPDPRLHSLNSLVTAFSNSKAFDAHTEKRLKGRKNVANSEAKSERQFVYVSDEISADFPLKIFFYSRCCTTSTTMENMKMGKKCEVRKNQQRILLFLACCMCSKSTELSVLTRVRSDVVVYEWENCAMQFVFIFIIHRHRVSAA